VATELRKFREAVPDQHQDHRIRNLLVKDIMSTPLISIDRNTHVADVIDTMVKKNISTVPVTDKGKLVGLVTRRSLVMAL